MKHKILENEIVNIKSEIHKINDIVNKFSSDLKKEVELVIQPFYEILKKVEEKVFKVYEEAFKLKENSEKTNTKITHAISTQTDNILVNSLPSVSKYSEKSNETNNPVLSQNSHGSQGSSSQSSQENKTGPENVDIKNLEYNVEVSNRFAALDPLQAKHKQVTPPKANKYSTVRKLTEKFQHLIIHM